MNLRHALAAAACCIACSAIGAGSAHADTILIGAEDAAAPWSNADGTGYVNDLVRAAFDSAGWQVEFSVVPYARCKLMAVAGALAACFSASRTPELEGKLLYPKYPVFRARNLLIARQASTLSGCDPAGWGKPPVFGIVRGYEYRAALWQLFATKRARAEEADSETSNLHKLDAQRVDAIVVTVDAVKRLEFVQGLANAGRDAKVVCDYGAEPAYVAFSAVHPQAHAALAAFERGYAEIERSGRIAALQRQWRGRLLDMAPAKKP